MPIALQIMRATIASAKANDADAIDALRGVLRAWADTGYPHEVVALAEALCEVREALLHRGNATG